MGPTAVEPGPFGGANSLSCIDWAHDMCRYLAQAGQIISKCNTSAQPHKTNRWDYSSQYVSKGSSLCILWLSLEISDFPWKTEAPQSLQQSDTARISYNEAFAMLSLGRFRCRFCEEKNGKKEIATQKPCQAVDFSSVIWRWGSVSCNLLVWP